MDLISILVLAIVILFLDRIGLLFALLICCILMYFFRIQPFEGFGEDYSEIPTRHIGRRQYNMFENSGYGDYIHWSKRLPSLVPERYSYNDCPCKSKKDLYSSQADFAYLPDLSLNMSKYLEV